MSVRVWVFRAIGLAGAGAVAYGIHGVISAADCAASEATCSVSPGGGALVCLIGGIVAGIVATIGGGGFVVFGAMFTGIGVGALVAGLQAPPDAFAHVFGLVFGGIFALVGLAVAVLAVAGVVVVARRAALLSGGARGVATVLDVHDTGMTVNDDPRLRLDLQVVPLDESPPFRTSVTGVVSRVRIPRPGDRLGVAFDPGRRERVVIDPAQHAPGLPVEAASAPLRGAGPGAPAYGTPDAAARSVVDELERLARLHASGAITDAEFATLKARLLA